MIRLEVGMRVMSLQLIVCPILLALSRDHPTTRLVPLVPLVRHLFTGCRDLPLLLYSLSKSIGDLLSGLSSDGRCSVGEPS